MMNREALRTKFEEMRQASSIHGGVFKLFVAALGVKLARVKIPNRRLRVRLYRGIYGRKYADLNENELDRSLGEYSSFNELFTRGVLPGCRPFSENGNKFLCPCDGMVQDVGTLKGDKILTIKGIEYTMAALLPGMDTRPLEGGHYAILFLSPSDCHRVFSPQDGSITKVVHVPGYRLLVHPPYQKKDFPVFALNERVIIHLETPLGACILVMVAGWGVGNITLRFDEQFKGRHKTRQQKSYTAPIPVTSGQWLATFELGSTVILITAPRDRLAQRVHRQDRVQYGCPLFSFGE
jgi:phosphatidylserine decarboxylase